MKLPGYSYYIHRIIIMSTSTISVATNELDFTENTNQIKSKMNNTFCI